MKLRFTCNWCSDEELMKRIQDNFLEVDEIQCVTDSTYDYLVIFNQLRDHSIFKDKSKTIAFIMEPSWSLGIDARIHEYSKHVFVHDKSLFGNHSELIESPSFMFCHDKINKHDYINSTFPKTKNISLIVSNKTSNHHLQSYNKRIDVLSQILNSNLDIDIYGNGHSINDSRYKGELIYKYDGIKPYKFSIGIENCSEKNYVTEKFVDITVCNSIPIYWGAPNINDIYNNGGFFSLNLSENIVVQLKSFLNCDYNKMLPFVLENKKKYFCSYNILNIIKDYICHP